MSSSRHRISLGAPLRDVRAVDGTDTLISERKFRQMLEEEYRRGVDAGQKTLGEQLVQQRKQLLEIQTGVLRSIERALPDVIAECEKSIVLLALESAKRVVQQMPIDSGMIEQTVMSALAELKDTAEYEVLVHPEDLALLQEVQSGILPRPENKQVYFRPDSRISRGDCVVNTRHGSIAATREHMFEKMESAVLC